MILLFNPKQSCDSRAQRLDSCLENGGKKGYVKNSANSFLNIRNNCIGCQHNEKCDSKDILIGLSILDVNAIDQKQKFL